MNATQSFAQDRGTGATPAEGAKAGATQGTFTTSDLMSRKNLGDVVEPITVESVNGSSVCIPPKDGFLHLQFRRFAGCPICNLHLRSFIRRHDELLVHGIHEVAVFHSPKSAMLEYQTSGPFPFIADPDKTLYKAFGVETSIWSILNPRTWPAAIKGIFLAGARLPSRGESSLGLPADFLIDTSGKIVALKYGKHASDHWEFDELLELAKAAGKESQGQTTG